MPGWLIASILIGLVYAAAWRYGVDSRDGQDWNIRREPAPRLAPTPYRAHSPARDLATLWRAVRRVLADMRELQERRIRLDRPWEEGCERR
ncbi:hypothetical protein ACFQE5_07795 [Pseudonocardia hispaniensis]|uniref:Uncharacterized protein n=1 Tax=Pseudonocardia hispaniensis TaxID=904933 RepID=A0ABW1J009_9PSEU